MMFLTLSSKEFSFERADATLLPQESDGGFLVDPALISTAELVDNRTENLNIEHPGDFVLQLAQLTVRWARDGRRYFVPIFINPSTISLTDGQLKSTRATVKVNPEGLFRMTVVDRAQRPVANRNVTFYANWITMRIKSDENGSMLFLCNPTTFRIEIDSETGVIIQPM